MIIKLKFLLVWQVTGVDLLFLPGIPRGVIYSIISQTGELKAKRKLF